MDLTDQLDRLRAAIDRIDEVRRGLEEGTPSPDEASQACDVLGLLTSLQRRSGWAMRAAVEQVRATGVSWETLAAHVGIPVRRLTDQFDSGGPIVVDDPVPGRGQETATANGPRHSVHRDADGFLGAIERQLAVVEEQLREAIRDADELKRIRDEATEPKITGRAAAHRTLALGRWGEALGARAQLKALYQEVAGLPSPSHESSTRILGELGVQPNPVGLDGRHPDTAAFLREHGTEEVDEPRPPAERVRSDRGLEL